MSTICYIIYFHENDSSIRVTITFYDRRQNTCSGLCQPQTLWL